MSNLKEKYNKLILSFERTTGKNAIHRNKLTKNFKQWLQQKKYVVDPILKKQELGVRKLKRRKLKSKKTSMIENFTDDLIEKLEKLKNFLQYKNQKFCQKYINDIIKELGGKR